MTIKLKLFNLIFLLFSIIAYSQKSPLEIKPIGKIDVQDKLKLELKNISKDTIKLVGNLYLDSRAYVGLKSSGLDYSYIKECDTNITTSSPAEFPRYYGAFDEKIIIIEPESIQNVVVWFPGGKRYCSNTEKDKLKITYNVELSDDFIKIYEGEKNNYNNKIADFEKKFSVLKNSATLKDMKNLSYLLEDLIKAKKKLKVWKI